MIDLKSIALGREGSSPSGCNISMEDEMTTLQKSEYIYNKILKDGYILSREIWRMFNRRNIIQVITVIENLLDVQLYDDVIRVLRNGKTEKSKSGDKYKYKTVKVYRSQTELFKQWRKEAGEMNGQANGRVITNQRGLWRVAG